MMKDLLRWFQGKLARGSDVASGEDRHTLPAGSTARRQVESGQESATGIPTKVLERYSDAGEVGRGGMARVHRVLDKTLLRDVALKVLRPEFAGKERLVQRFIREAQITAQLDHPNIVPIHELGRDEETMSFYINLKMVHGQTLTKALKRAGEERLQPDRLAEFLDVFHKVCQAVAFAHSRGVVHRDLKPSNIMVGEFGQVYVMDWGVARLLPTDEGPAERRVTVSDELEEALSEEPGNIIGTPRYMPPEQVRGQHDRVDQRSDVFALGAILYQVLTGQPPYASKSYYKTLLEAQAAKIPPPESVVDDSRLPAGLSQIALRAMAYEPEDRFASVSELTKELDRFLRGGWDQVIQRLPAGSAIVTEGDEGDVAYVILDGRCRVYTMASGEKMVLRELGPGEVFAETAVFSSARRSASVEALDDVTLKVVSRETLTTGLGLNSWMGTFVKALADRFREVDEELRQLKAEKSADVASAPGPEVRGPAAT